MVKAEEDDFSEKIRGVGNIAVDELPIVCRGVSCSYTSRFLIGFKREQQEGEIFRKVCSKRSLPGET